MGTADPHKHHSLMTPYLLIPTFLYRPGSDITHTHRLYKAVQYMNPLVWKVGNLMNMSVSEPRFSCERTSFHPSYLQKGTLTRYLLFVHPCGVYLLATSVSS